MDAVKFGAFLAKRRKERNMTQAELADRLQITDKAVSRWERGVGLPDISMLEPLSEALEISVLELLRSEQLEGQDMSPAEVSDAVTDTIRVAVEQRRAQTKRILLAVVCAACVLAIPAIALLVGAADFPFQLFFCFVLPLWLLCTIEYGLYRRNRTIAVLLPVITVFSGAAFGPWALALTGALLVELVILYCAGVPWRQNRK